MLTESKRLAILGTTMDQPITGRGEMRNKREKCDVCGKRRVIVHVVEGGGQDAGAKYCRACDDEWQANPAPCSASLGPDES